MALFRLVLFHCQGHPFSKKDTYVSYPPTNAMLVGGGVSAILILRRPNQRPLPESPGFSMVMSMAVPSGAATTAGAKMRAAGFLGVAWQLPTQAMRVCWDMCCSVTECCFDQSDISCVCIVYIASVSYCLEGASGRNSRTMIGGACQSPSPGCMSAT